jgi:hypothetical protein
MSTRTTAHKIKLGEAVLFAPDPSEAIYQSGAVGTVTRLLPKDADEYQYHIRFGPDDQQRRARESQLRLLAETKV